ncbi:hypothetical protein [Candidatus Parabeggiatoa sp. HSG14]|uniref:hypothetical protein n=1 Tax=Candidatus Parabeggiatoa sp. HSG14 TaxID=3055593 RepID=UPI0025A8361A|nr:hypothetical protein [Thiotrichales bacterium HSG14]
MSEQKEPSKKEQAWIDVKKRFHLSNKHIQMAKELRMNPNRFGNSVNYKQEHWKTALSKLIENSHLKRFGKQEPDEPKQDENT